MTGSFIMWTLLGLLLVICALLARASLVRHKALKQAIETIETATRHVTQLTESMQRKPPA